MIKNLDITTSVVLKKKLEIPEVIEEKLEDTEFIKQLIKSKLYGESPYEEIKKLSVNCTDIFKLKMISAICNIEWEHVYNMLLLRNSVFTKSPSIAIPSNVTDFILDAYSRLDTVSKVLKTESSKKELEALRSLLVEEQKNMFIFFEVCQKHPDVFEQALHNQLMSFFIGQENMERLNILIDEIQKEHKEIYENIKKEIEFKLNQNVSYTEKDVDEFAKELANFFSSLSELKDTNNYIISLQ